MSIKVTTVDGGVHVVANATTWHVDDAHGLHLKDAAKKPAATFASTKWIAVERGTDA